MANDRSKESPEEYFFPYYHIPRCGSFLGPIMSKKFSNFSATSSILDHVVSLDKTHHQDLKAWNFVSGVILRTLGQIFQYLRQI